MILCYQNCFISAFEGRSQQGTSQMNAKNEEPWNKILTLKNINP